VEREKEWSWEHVGEERICTSDGGGKLGDGDGGVGGGEDWRWEEFIGGTGVDL